MTTSTPSSASTNSLHILIIRLHFYIGLFIGPFIFIAALTGALYVLSPQLENVIYSEELTTTSQGEQQSLQTQIAAAKSSLTQQLDLLAVRPAPYPTDTTRVIFRDPSVEFAHTRAVFVDPVTLDVKGNLAVYGTSGVLPLRIYIDHFHRQLMAGEFGRYYSELAASWLWIAALGGLYLWWRGGRRNQRDFSRKTPRLKTRRRHGQLGLVIMLGLMLFSATGLTWSKWAGNNISKIRAEFGWVTPSPTLSLAMNGMGPAEDEHAEHKGMVGMAAGHQMPSNDQLFDPILKVARAAGIDAAKLEIKPAQTADSAWLVREIDASWPTQVDSVAINPYTLKVTSSADFADFPFIAKLIRWGIDVHMGNLFGLANKLILAAFGLAACLMIVWGYRMWWLRRPLAGPTAKPLLQAWSQLSKAQQLISVLIGLILGVSLPVMGVSLITFLVIDAIRWHLSGSKQTSSRTA